MNDDQTFELTQAVRSLETRMDVHNARQEEANELTRTLISTLQSLAQEIADLRKDLDAADGSRIKIPPSKKS